MTKHGPKSTAIIMNFGITQNTFYQKPIPVQAPFHGTEFLYINFSKSKIILV